MNAARRTLLPTAMLLARLGTGCSVGTEVGNGVKPKDGGNPPAVTPNAASNGGQPSTTDTATAAASTTSPPQAAPGILTNAPVGSTPAVPGGSVIGNPFNPALERLFADCASPFGAANVAAPIVLSHKTASGARDNKINANFISNAQTWKISDLNLTLYRQLVLDPTHGLQAVITYDATYQRVSTPYTCSSIITDSAAVISGSTTIYTKLSVNLTNTLGQVYPLAWYLLDPGGGAAMQLKRVEISPSDGSAAFIMETE